MPKDRFTALTRLDHNRALFQLAHRAGVHVSQVRRMSIWGNHSSTQYPDAYHAVVAGRSGAELAADASWLLDEFIPRVAERGAEIIEARGVSSQISAAQAAIGHVHDWFAGTPAGDWTSAGLWATGEHYGVPQGIVCSFPVTSDGTGWTVVEGLAHGPLAQSLIRASVAELVEERESVRALGLI